MFTSNYLSVSRGFSSRVISPASFIRAAVHSRYDFTCVKSNNRKAARIVIKSNHGTMKWKPRRRILAGSYKYRQTYRETDVSKL